MKVGFVNIFGKPNAGKSTLLNALVGEKLAIVSPKVQTTRNRIRGFLNESGQYQVIFSDTPGIIEAKYKLQEKMMDSVKSALEDADLALLVMEASDNELECDALFSSLNLKVPCLVLINKIDLHKEDRAVTLVNFFRKKSYCRDAIAISALSHDHLKELLNLIVEYLPVGEPYFSQEDLTDLPMKFFVGEMVREKIYYLFSQELPYQTAVLVNSYKDEPKILKIEADIIVQRESQRGIIIGAGGKMIKRLGMDSRMDIEKFVGKKVFLKLFVKIRPHWRDSDFKLKEYGY